MSFHLFWTSSLHRPPPPSWLTTVSRACLRERPFERWLQPPLPPPPPPPLTTSNSFTEKRCWDRTTKIPLGCCQKDFFLFSSRSTVIWVHCYLNKQKNRSSKAKGRRGEENSRLPVGECKSGTSCECTIHSSVSCWRIGCIQNIVGPRCVYGVNYHLQLHTANTSWLLHLSPHVCWELTASKLRDRFGWNLLQQTYIKFCRVILMLISFCSF